MEITTKSPDETKKLGSQIANNLTGGGVYALVGDLGSGKTTFAQGFTEELGIERVNSPTFIILRKYDVKSKNSKVKNLFHVDLYRLEHNIEHELVNLGVTELWDKKENIFLIEWADKVNKNVFPKKTKWIKFYIQDDSERLIIFDK